MSDETSPASGNRWEPTEQPTEPPTEQPTDPATELPTAQVGWVPPHVPEYAEAEPVARTPWLTRARTAVAGGAVAVLIAGGLGGFALGRASAGGGDDDVRPDQQGVPSGFDRDGDGFAPGQGQPPDGQVPGRNGADDGQQNSNGSDSLDS